MAKSHLYILLFVSSLLWACKKESTDSAPELSFISISKTTVKEFQDSLFVMVEYKDLNGDIGTLDPDAKSLFVQDERYDNPEEYHIPPITPDEKKLKVQGNLRIYIPTLIRRSTGAEEYTYLAIKLKDRAGNWSNTVRTPRITITP